MAKPVEIFFPHGSRIDLYPTGEVHLVFVCKSQYEANVLFDDFKERFNSPQGLELNFKAGKVKT